MYYLHRYMYSQYARIYITLYYIIHHNSYYRYIIYKNMQESMINDHDDTTVSINNLFEE